MSWPTEADAWPLDQDDDGGEDWLPRMSVSACACNPDCRRVVLYTAKGDVGLTEKAGRQLLDILKGWYE